MGAQQVRWISGLLRVAALSGAAAAFMLIAPGQANAADPLAPVSDLTADVAEPLVDAAQPALPLLEPATDPVVAATKPVTDPVVGATKPIVDRVVDSLDPIVDPLPSVPAPPPAIAAGDDPRAARDQEAAQTTPALTDTERSAPIVRAATRRAPLDASAPSADELTTARSVAASHRLAAVPALAVPAQGTNSPLPQTGDGLLVGVLAAVLIGIAAGWRRLSIDRLRLPSGLALAPPVPPG
jgi:hypothetical protein